MATRDEVVRLREKGLTYAQIGLVCGIGKPQVRQILKSRARRDKIIELRKSGLTYAKIGSRFGISKERVRQILTPKPPKPAPQKPTLESKVMLTTGDVAQFLGLHTNTVRRWNAKGILKSYRISSRGDRRFRREDVDGFLKEGEIE